MPIRKMLGVVGIKEETTAGTFVEPTVTYPAYDISYTVDNGMWDNKMTTTHFGKLAPYPIAAAGEISFKIPWVGGANATTEPYWSLFMIACGYKQEDLAAPDGYDYTPRTTFDTTDAGAFKYPKTGKYSVSFHQDGVRYGLAGCMGNMVLSCKAGEPMVMEFTFKGAYDPVVDDSPASPTSSSIVPPLFNSALFSTQGWNNANFDTLTLDTGNVLSPIVSANAASGIMGFQITDRKPVLKFNPNLELVATHNFFSLWRAATVAQVDFGPIGTGAGRTLTFLAAQSVYSEPTLGEREGMVTVEMTVPILNSTATEGADFNLKVL